MFLNDKKNRWKKIELFFQSLNFLNFTSYKSLIYRKNKRIDYRIHWHQKNKNYYIIIIFYIQIRDF